MQKIPVRHINASQHEPDLSGSFTIRDIQSLLAGNDMVQPLHRHDFYYALALEKGRGNHEIDFTPYTVTDHSVFLMRPGQVHQLVLEAGSTGYLMQFRDEFLLPHDKASRQLLRKVGNVSHYQLGADSFRKLVGILGYIYQEDLERQDRYKEVIKANIGMFFIELSRHGGKNDISDAAGLYAQTRLNEFLELVEEHAFAHKQVSEYAAMMNLSVYQLNAVTKSTLNKTCSELINELMILEARRHLLATSNHINEIADQLGYEDVSYFTRFFKKHTGYSPEAFRQNFR